MLLETSVTRTFLLSEHRRKQYANGCLLLRKTIAERSLVNSNFFLTYVIGGLCSPFQITLLLYLLRY